MAAIHRIGDVRSRHPYLPRQQHDVRGLCCQLSRRYICVQQMHSCTYIYIQSCLHQVLSRGLEICMSECRRRGINKPIEMVLWAPGLQYGIPLLQSNPEAFEYHILCQSLTYLQAGRRFAWLSIFMLDIRSTTLRGRTRTGHY